MDDVRVKAEESCRYASRAKHLRAEEIDAFVRESLAALRAAHPAAGPAFSIYRGCSKEDEQIVEVCLPTPAGEHEWPGGEVAYTVARGAETDYPQILGAYDAVAAYAAAARRELAGPPRETYLTETEMEIAFPLAP
ncbi:MAG: hypothetical protein QOG85_338 [Gaiellaceae bacterium]|jgi:hypothetical protein|nr:hypothetical protein [Gaiellaceae bacterium]